MGLVGLVGLLGFVGHESLIGWVSLDWRAYLGVVSVLGCLRWWAW